MCWFKRARAAQIAQLSRETVGPHALRATQGRQHIGFDHALEIAARIGHQIPQRAVVPEIQILPIGAVDDRIQANAFDRDFFGARNADLHRDLAQPGSATHAEMPGLADQQRASIARVHLSQYAMKGQTTVIRWRLVPQDALTVMFPLIAVVVIDANNIEIVGPTAQLWMRHAGNHVPGFELAQSIFFRIMGQFGPIAWGDDMNDRIDVQKARTAIHRTHRVHAGNRCAYQLAFQLMPAMFRIGVKKPFFAGGPG